MEKLEDQKLVFSADNDGGPTTDAPRRKQREIIRLRSLAANLILRLASQVETADSGTLDLGNLQKEDRPAVSALLQETARLTRRKLAGRPRDPRVDAASEIYGRWWVKRKSPDEKFNWRPAYQAAGVVGAVEQRKLRNAVGQRFPRSARSVKKWVSDSRPQKSLRVSRSSQPLSKSTKLRKERPRVKRVPEEKRKPTNAQSSPNCGDHNDNFRSGDSRRSE